jgi:hypothetical protein
MSVEKAAWWVAGWACFIARWRSIGVKKSGASKRLRGARRRLCEALEATQGVFDFGEDATACTEKDAVNPRAEHGTERAGG